MRSVVAVASLLLGAVVGLVGGLLAHALVDPDSGCAQGTSAFGAADPCGRGPDLPWVLVGTAVAVPLVALLLVRLLRRLDA